MNETMFSLKNKTAIITGGATGIGFEISLLFARRGAQVFVVDLNETGALNSAALINKAMNSTSSAYGIACDVSSSKSVQTCFNRVVTRAKNGRVDILCNNAGIGHVGNILNTNESNLDRVMKVNVNGVFNCAKEAVNLMVKDNGGGVILNTGSCASICKFRYSLSRNFCGVGTQ